MNNLTIVGRLVKTPELKKNADGCWCYANVAVQVSKERTDFFNCKLTGKQAENCCRYTSKGDLVCIRGSVTLSYWGENNEKASLSVVGCSMEFYGKRSAGDGGGSAPNVYSARQTGNSGNAPQEAPDDEFAGYTQLDDEDLPF